MSLKSKFTLLFKHVSDKITTVIDVYSGRYNVCDHCRHYITYKGKTSNKKGGKSVDENAD